MYLSGIDTPGFVIQIIREVEKGLRQFEYKDSKEEGEKYPVS
jgi:hypothetical protein